MCLFIEMILFLFSKTRNGNKKERRRRRRKELMYKLCKQ
jgi:hypothetical protein